MVSFRSTILIVLVAGFMAFNSVEAASPLDVLKPVIDAAVKSLKDTLATLLATIQAALKIDPTPLLQQLLEAVKSIIANLNKIIDDLLKAVQGLLSGLPNASELISQIQTTVNGVVDELQDAVGDLLNSLSDVLATVR
jgi:phage-related protein